MMKQRRWRGAAGVLAAAVVAAAWPSVAGADALEGARSKLVVERDHTIRLKLGYDHAELVVRRTVHNGGARHDQATFWIEVPDGAVAAGLRTLGEQNGQPRWFDAELLEAETAAERYRELTGIGGYYPKDPALLSWRSQDELALQVFPVAPRSPKTVEYTFYLPTEYRDGRYRLSLSPMGLTKRPAALVLEPSRRLDQLFLDGVPVGRGTRLELDREVDIAVARRDAPQLDGRLGSVAFGDDRVLVQYRMQTAAKLSEIPRGAHVVVLLDASRSLSEIDAAAQVSAARAYLDHFADRKLRAKAEVVTFAREPRRRHGRLVAADRALADLEHLVLTRENGSHVDAALATAVEILDEAPRRAPRRIVVLTDTRTRSALRPERMRTAARRSGAVVHVVEISEGEPSLERDDTHAWDVVTRPTGGLVWWANATDDTETAPQMQKVFEELARPVRIDHLEILASELTAEPAWPRQLDEGQGIAELFVNARPVRHVALRGQLWSRPMREVVTPDREHGRLWSGLVFGSELLGDLDEAEMMPLAMFGRVVSPVTSFLAIEPGVRPSTEGLDWSESFGMGGIGLVGVGSGGGGLGLGSNLGLDREAWLRAALAGSLKRCGAHGANAEVKLETTQAEIVDVPSVRVDGADATTRACVTDEIWALTLPGAFDRQFQVWTVTAA